VSRWGAGPRNGAGLPRKLLVTGAAGFIGSHLVERLLEDGYEVWGLDNFDPAYSPAAKRANLREVVRHPRMHMIEGDLRDTVLLDGLFGDRSFDAVLHLAALSAPLSPLDDPQLCFQVNLLGTVNLLEAMRRRGVQRIVFTSDRSLSTRGGAEGDEAFAPSERPATSFSAAKRSVELLCHVHHRTYRTSVHILRLAAVYGPREGPDGPVHRIARRLTGQADAAPDAIPAADEEYLYVADAVEGLVSSLETLLEAPAESPVFEIVTLRGEQVVSAGELESRLAAALGIEPAETARAKAAAGNGEGGAVRAAVRASQAVELLGFRPDVSLDEGLARFAEWFGRRGPSPASLSGSGAR